MARTDRRTRRRAAAVALCLIGLGLPAGCGNSRTAVPSLYRPATPPPGFPRKGVLPYGFPNAGFGLLVPSNWTNLTNQAQPPVVMIAGSGGAVISVSRYARTSPAPVGADALQRAGASLLSAVRARDASFTLQSTHTLTVAGRPAVQLRGTERISGQLRRVISSHIYLPHSELVLEEYASPRDFARVDREVFADVTRSFVLLHEATR